MWGRVLGAIPGKRAAAYGAVLVTGLVLPFRVGVVRGESMSPSLANGQVYLLDRSSRAFHRGDVVVFHHAGGTYVKRVLGGPGDTIQLLDFNGEPDEVARDWQMRVLTQSGFQKRTRTSMRLRPYRVPDGALYLVGDNLFDSVDSRDFGSVPVRQVEGKVLFAPPPAWEWTRLAVAPQPSPRRG